MPRLLIPDNEQTPKQIQKRIYNKRYQEKVKSKLLVPMNKQLKEKNVVVINEKKKEKEKEKTIEKKSILAMVGNDSVGDFSNNERVITQSNFSNVIAFPKSNERENFSNELLNQLQKENLLLREKISQLEAKKTPSVFEKIKNIFAAIFSFLIIIPIPCLLIWQVKEMLETLGNKQGLWLALGLEYAVMLAAASAGLSKKLAGKLLGLVFVFAFTAVMASFVISGVEKKAVTGSEQYKMTAEQREMVLADRVRAEKQLEGLPLDYKSKRAEVQKRVEESTEAIVKLDHELITLQKSGGGENPLANYANMASRILLMLLEAWMVHMVFSTILRRRNVMCPQF